MDRWRTNHVRQLVPAPPRQLVRHHSPTGPGTTSQLVPDHLPNCPRKPPPNWFRTTSANWFRNHLANWFRNHLKPTRPGACTTNSPRGVHNQLAPGRAQLAHARAGSGSIDGFVHERCLSPATRAPLCPPRAPAGVERRRRWSRRTRARAQAACHRHPSCLAVSHGFERWRAACAERADVDQQWRRDRVRPLQRELVVVGLAGACTLACAERTEVDQRGGATGGGRYSANS